MGGVPKRIYLFEKKNDCECGHFFFFGKKTKQTYGNPFAVLGTENNIRFERLFERR